MEKLDNATLKARDLKHIWHPCSQMKDYEQNIPLIPIKKAKGVHLYDYDGNSYIDGISSWWVNVLGHSHHAINQALKRQSDALPHTIFAGFTHEPAIKLSERIVELTPEPLQKVFFADNGSSAVEAALKMSFHYHKIKGKIKPYFVSLENSYHGETLGAMAISDVALYKETYNELLLPSLQLEVPFVNNDTKYTESDIHAYVQKAKWQLSGRDDICAIVIEPLVQCAGSMKMYDARFIAGLREICDTLQIHLIADEIAVGFGRTGTLFAMEQAKVAPDILLLSKSLTAGYLPLALAVTTDEIYNAFYDDYNTYKAFLHSHSYTGNALACAVANATLDFLIDKNIIQKNQSRIAYIAKKVKRFSALKSVKAIRQTGMILAIELEFDIKKRLNIDIYNFALKKGVYLRPLANVVYFMPPYVIKKSQIDQVLDVAYEAIETICG